MSRSPESERCALRRMMICGASCGKWLSFAIHLWMSRQGRTWVADRKEGHPRLNCRKCRANFRPTALREKWVWLAVDPVQFEPVSPAKLPANREIYREFATEVAARPAAKGRKRLAVGHCRCFRGEKDQGVLGH